MLKSSRLVLLSLKGGECSNLVNVMFQRNYYFCFVLGVNQLHIYLVVNGPMFMGE